MLEIRTARTDVVEQDSLEVALRSGRTEPPHVLIAAETFAKTIADLPDLLAVRNYA